MQQKSLRKFYRKYIDTLYYVGYFLIETNHGYIEVAYMIIRLSLIILLFAQVSVWGQAKPERPVSFYAEEITLEVNDSTASVSGMYCFRNNSDKEGYFPLAFPFYVDIFRLTSSRVIELSDRLMA